MVEGYCWTRTAERQAARMRYRYLKAVLRQDVGYFDLHVGSTSEVIISVSSDSLAIQDVISEKVNLSCHECCFILLIIIFLRVSFASKQDFILSYFFIAFSPKISNLVLTYRFFTQYLFRILKFMGYLYNLKMHQILLLF